MKHVKYCLILTAFLIILSIPMSVVAQSQFTEAKEIEGVYEFISQEMRLTQPNKEVLILSNSEWKGLWQIYNGFFSSSLMKNERSKFFDCKSQDFGYESFSGTYIIKDKRIIFKRIFSFHPFFKDQEVAMKYEFRKGNLILTQILTPYLEDMREGTITLTLSRIYSRNQEVSPKSYININP